MTTTMEVKVIILATIALLLITFPRGITLIPGFFELFPSFLPFLCLIRHAHFFI